MFKKILIANRGEIARRIIRTCKKMGIKTVAIYSEADTNALHVSEADEAVFVGPSPSDQSYLVIENILDAVLQTGAEAVHPGYGFLSENEEFAHALKRAGVAFIGPDTHAIAAMGDKIESKKCAQSANVSTVPGYTGVIHDVAEAVKIANDIGYPVMIKASAGGGGKGMRIVQSEPEVAQAFTSATNEAKKSFGDGRVFIEKFIENPRHIEIQVLADKHGNIVCLGERECSIQRHNQKVIEEAPSPVIDEATRQKMYAQSKALAAQVKYESAGTIEYIMDQQKNFYFLEMNTRLQVEHPVTEYVTGYDLVELMIRVAAGEKLPMTQDDVKLTGWAIESRIYAEDPTRGFLPSTGRITEYREPPVGKQVRVDSGVYSGGEVSMFYDAMIAKLITYGETRDQAIERMQESLGQYLIRGVSHNISFLEALIRHERFRRGDLATNFIAQEYPGGFSGAELHEEHKKVLLAAGVYIYLTDAKRAANTSGQEPGRQRLIPTRWVVTVGDDNFSVNIRHRKDGYDIQNERHRFGVYSNWILGSRLFQGTVDGRPVSVRIRYVAGGYVLTYGGVSAKVFVRTPRVAELAKYMPQRNDDDLKSLIQAPISGVVVDVKVQEGQAVVAGQELVILEAMKMENILYAEADATIAKVHVKAGQNVAVNEILLEFAQETAEKADKPEPGKKQHKDAAA